MTDRKNPWHMTPLMAMQADLTEFTRQGGGMMQMHLVRVTDKQKLAAALDRHDPAAIAITRTIMQALKGIRARSKTSPMQCAACDVRFVKPRTTPAAFVVMLPGVRSDREFNGLSWTAPLCTACNKKPEREIIDAAMELVRRAFENVEEVEI